MTTMTPIAEEAVTSTALFTDFELSSEILSAIVDMGFETPSSIQKESIPQVLNGIDIIAQAPTGSGKTASYAIPLLELLLRKVEENAGFKNNISALVLCPTRELVIQVHKEFDKLTKYMDDFQTVSIYGGQRIERQLDALKRNPQIIVATPGRLMDHLRRGSIKLNNVDMVVLDEADEMLDMGFREDIHTILEDTPAERQTILFSATMAKDIIALTKKFQKSPLIIDVTDNLLNAPDIAQSYFEVVEKEKPELITRLLELHNMKLALVFCNTKTNVDKVVEILKTRGYFAEGLHGDMNQSQREKVMRGFSKGSVKILVATDVAGRGIDVKDVEGVFNYDLPRDDEDYIHRIGRTGRAGKSGIAFSFISKRQISSLRRIERANGLKIEKGELPSFEDISSAKFSSFMNEVKEMIVNTDLTEQIEKINSMIDENNSLLNIAAALYKMSTNREAMKINKKLEFSEEEYDENSRDDRRRHSRSKDRGSRNRDRMSNRGSRDGFRIERKKDNNSRSNEERTRYNDVLKENKQSQIDMMVEAVKSFDKRSFKGGKGKSPFGSKRDNKKSFSSRKRGK